MLLLFCCKLFVDNLYLIKTIVITFSVLLSMPKRNGSHSTDFIPLKSNDVEHELYKF